MIFRPDYIKAIEPFIDKPLVKILAGIRRCGKSTIFEMLKAELIDRGTEEARIIHRSYTDMDMPENITAKEMYAELTSPLSFKRWGKRIVMSWAHWMARAICIFSDWE